MKLELVNEGPNLWSCRRYQIFLWWRYHTQWLCLDGDGRVAWRSKYDWRYMNTEKDIVNRIYTRV